MNQHVKEWLKALRSGKYKQGRGALKQGDLFCCLGVACDISGLDKWQTGITTSLETYLDKVGSLPVENMRRLELSNTAGVFDIKNINTKDKQIQHLMDSSSACALAHLNDEGVSFNQIADFIEENWDALKQ